MCDTACVRQTEGLLFVKSSDRPVDEVQLLRWFGRRPGGGELGTTYTSVRDPGAAAVLGSQPVWMWGLEHGVNEHRVAIGNERIWTVDDPHSAPPALLGMDLVRLGLERSTTADGAVDTITSLLEAHGQGGSGACGTDEPYWSSFLVVDPSGGWVVETSARQWVAQPVGDGAAISNRLTVTTGWTRGSSGVPAGSDWDRWRAPEVPTGIADHRLAATRRWVATGAAATPTSAVAALRDHGTGPWGEIGRSAGPVVAPPEDVRGDWSGVTPCMHVRGYQCTTASLVADLPVDDGDPLRVWASLGTPCTGVFLPVAVLGDGAVLARTLGDERSWRAFAALGRRVEQPGAAGEEALATARAVLAPLEAEAWEQADALWHDRAGSDAWRAAAAGWDAGIAAALRRLAVADGGGRSGPSTAAPAGLTPPGRARPASG